MSTPPPRVEQTDACENITFATQAVKISCVCLRYWGGGGGGWLEEGESLGRPKHSYSHTNYHLIRGGGRVLSAGGVVVTAAGGTHPTGMHSCFIFFLNFPLPHHSSPLETETLWIITARIRSTGHGNVFTRATGRRVSTWVVSVRGVHPPPPNTVNR